MRLVLCCPGFSLADFVGFLLKKKVQTFFSRLLTNGPGRDRVAMAGSDVPVPFWTTRPATLAGLSSYLFFNHHQVVCLHLYSLGGMHESI